MFNKSYSLWKRDNYIFMLFFISTKLRKSFKRMEVFFLREAFVRAEMTLKSFVPFAHSVDLVLIVLLSRAL